jgi:transposase
MEGLSASLPNDLNALKAMLQQQQDLIEKQQSELSVAQQQSSRQQQQIERLEERLRYLLRQQFGQRAERHPDQYQLFNEAELLAQAAPSEDTEQEDCITVPTHQRRRQKADHALPDDLPRVEVLYELDADETHCPCGEALKRIGEQVLEQLAVIPQQYYVIRHIRPTYACGCKQCIRTASMPKQPLPGSQASASLLAHIMVSKYLDGLPLYRQEKIAAREKIKLPRAKQARWLIDGSELLQPLLNLFNDVFFSYDIAHSDDTGIRVLKAEGQVSSKQRALWIRRGGPPGKPVVLVDYAPSKSAESVKSLLSEFHGTLICDGAPSFNAVARHNGLTLALCNDHARRRFHKVCASLGNKKAGQSIAAQGLRRYQRLYAIEREAKDLSNDERLAYRQQHAIPVWNELLDWATRVQREGVSHGGTRDALDYLLKHADGLRQYCHDGRIPISNIRAEHVAKTIAIARKNFLFADTTAGAEASGRIFSLIETARANGHNPQRYLTVLLGALPNVTCVEDIEQLLPWCITPVEIDALYADYPKP